MQTPEDFRSLADLLRDECAQPPAPVVEAMESGTQSADSRAGEIAAARDVRLFRARVEEALESSIEALRCDIAAEVIGRELQLAPVAIAEIVQRAILRCHNEHLIRISVHPEDAGSLTDSAVEIVTDQELRRGDAVLQYANGTIDVSLGVRLDSVLRAYR